VLNSVRRSRYRQRIQYKEIFIFKKKYYYVSFKGNGIDFVFFPPLFCAVQKNPLYNLPSVTFKPGSFILSDSAKDNLNEVTATLQKHPQYGIVVTSYSSRTKQAQQLSWERVNVVVNYLASQKISRNRMIYRHGQPYGEEDIVDFRSFNDEK
jgi:outer membrane protein OmpA-like peptidoglycan-associated protein